MERKQFIKLLGGGLLGVCAIPFLDKLPIGKPQNEFKTEEWMEQRQPESPKVAMGELSFQTTDVSNFEPLLVQTKTHSVSFMKMALRLKEIEERL